MCTLTHRTDRGVTARRVHLPQHSTRHGHIRIIKAGVHVKWTMGFYLPDRNECATVVHPMTQPRTHVAFVTSLAPRVRMIHRMSMHHHLDAQILIESLCVCL